VTYSRRNLLKREWTERRLPVTTAAAAEGLAKYLAQPRCARLDRIQPTEEIYSTAHWLNLHTAFCETVVFSGNAV